MLMLASFSITPHLHFQSSHLIYIFNVIPIRIQANYFVGGDEKTSLYGEAKA